MTTTAIIKEINKLPLPGKLLVIEKTLETIRREKEDKLKQAVSLMYNDYKSDKELTAFTLLDAENFYEPR